MTLDALYSAFEDLGVSPQIREVCLHLWRTQEWEALQAVLNAAAEDTDGHCLLIDVEGMEEAPQAAPPGWAEAAAVRLIRAMRKAGGKVEVEWLSIFLLARLLEDEFDRRMAELAKEAARTLFDDPGFDSDPGPEEDDLP